MRAAMLLVLAAGPASAQITPCQQFENAIRAAEMDMAFEYAEGLGDNSAPRETTRLLRANNAWASINAHLSLMQANRCPPITRVIAWQNYLSSAIKCGTDRMKGDRNPASCKRSEWKSDGPS